MLMKYAKALAAFLGAIATTLLTLGTNPEVAGVLPDTATNWLLTAAGVVGTGLLGFLVRNRLTIEQIDAAIESSDLTIQDLKRYLNRKDGDSELPPNLR